VTKWSKLGTAWEGGGGIRLLDSDDPGFWESLGYHNDGDPWRERRYWGD
jgi:DMSO/TMAO reductase YedYZ molybdopterin-dependent catalytic subunit